MHGWDIRSRLEPEAHLSDDCLPVLMAFLPAQLSRFNFSPRSRLSEDICYRWELTGKGARDSDVIVGGDKAIMKPAGRGEADVTFQCDTETLVLVALGRLTIDAAKATGRLTIQGEYKQTHDFHVWFPPTD